MRDSLARDVTAAAILAVAVLALALLSQRAPCDPFATDDGELIEDESE
jgi:hypothetical protein